jgi:hypothetical protein
MNNIDGFWSINLIIFLGCSVCYAASFFAVIFISDFLQSWLLESKFYGSILFFPHGIRVLAAYMFGWRSVLYLTPVSVLLAYPFIIGWEAIPTILLAVVPQIAAVLSFEILGKFSFIEKNYLHAPLHWRSLVFCACFAAIMNAGLHFFLLEGFTAQSMSAIFVGDLLGFVVVLVIFMLGFKAARKVS